MGVLAIAAFVSAVVTGVLLAIPFDVRAPARSLELLEIASPVARLLRALHAWAGNLLVLFGLLHTIEHLALGSERRVRRGVWLRLLLLIPALLFLMISGFILKADAEGMLAHQIVSGLLDRLPLFGAEAALSLVGSATDHQLTYVHHVATSTIIVWVLVIDHARRLWPSASATLLTLGAALLLSLLFPPALHDGVNAAVKGPWYFVGLQEVLHWLTRPGWLWLAFALLLLWLAALPKLPRATARHSKVALLALLLLYVLVSLWALHFRGAGWDVVWPWARAKKISSRAPDRAFAPLSTKGASAARVPEILGHREGCVVCHDAVEGLSAAHSPSALGCRSCHLGNAYTLDAKQAHAGMVRVPGNLDSAKLSCGGAKCHGAIVDRVRGSMMATAVGMVAVDRFAFGEQKTPDGETPLSALGSSQADRHLKGLCIGCHLGTPKLKPAPIAETSRGGGCTACHLQYAKGKARYTPDRARAFTHPALNVAIGDEHCFGCHSRSGRISLSYRGWSETALSPKQAQGCPTQKGVTAICGPLVEGKPKYRLLADGRVLQRQRADIHLRGKMACIDCHGARDAMGDGRRHRHQDEAVEISCSDCHRQRTTRSVPFSALDAESQKTLRLRHPKRDMARDSSRYLLAERSDNALLNATVEKGGVLVVHGKLDGRKRRPKAPKPVCGAAVSGHERLSCRACHTGWAPRCVSCHTQFLPHGKTRDRLSGEILKGSFLEYLGTPRTSAPTLGVRRARGSKKTTIVPFAPGMVMTLNPGPKTIARGRVPQSAEQLIGKETIFRRLYAPVAPHTTTHKGRSCKSCHLDSIAIGYGQGKLQLVRPTSAPRSTTRPMSGSWRFDPAFAPAPQDGLPADAWIGLFGRPRQLAATRSDARPFTPEEQERILRVGACLGCHSYAKGAELYGDFKKGLERLTPRCVLPERAKKVTRR